MRVIVLSGLKVGLYLGLALLATPAAAGTLADYRATSGQFKVENGVRVYRVLAAEPQTYQNQIELRAAEQAFERGYKEGFETAFNARQSIRQRSGSQRKFTKSLKRSQTGRSRRNYGRRYSTSGSNPRFSRFRSNISYGRPAYFAFPNRN